MASIPAWAWSHRDKTGHCLMKGTGQQHSHAGSSGHRQYSTPRVGTGMPKAWWLPASAQGPCQSRLCQSVANTPQRSDSNRRKRPKNTTGKRTAQTGICGRAPILHKWSMEATCSQTLCPQPSNARSGLTFLPENSAKHVQGYRNPPPRPVAQIGADTGPALLRNWQCLERNHVQAGRNHSP